MPQPSYQQGARIPPPKFNPETDHVLQDLLRRAIRTESKLTQLMSHMEMKSDGRQPIEPGRNVA